MKLVVMGEGGEEWLWWQQEADGENMEEGMKMEGEGEGEVVWWWQPQEEEGMVEGMVEGMDMVGTVGDGEEEDGVVEDMEGVTVEGGEEAEGDGRQWLVYAIL